MKKFIVIVFTGLAAISLAGCSSTERGAAIGAGVGAVAGGVASGNVGGAAVGAAVGGVTGAVIGKVAGSETECYYEDSRGRLYRAECPRG